ncbi:MAG: DUF294 nucleotidyltransferase-like domain-containing protein [Geobacteraceae bacterium]|nr:DUF294 nucleotidyltransferase-like domain-containing protein [Geobacteraceae bacterium]
MALFPGAKGADILAWRGVAEVVGEIRRRSAERISSLLAEESIGLLKGLRGRLEQEIAFEEGFSAELSQAVEALERASSADDFTLLPRFDRLAEEYFRKRGSVVALHNFCNSCRDGLVRLVLLRTEERLAEEGMGRAPAPYCWLASGSMGRGEQTFCVAPSALLIYGDAPDGAGFFEQLASRAVALMEKIGLVPNDGGATAMEWLWRGSRKQWRREVAGKTAQGGEGFSGLAGCADLRPIYGDPVLAEEMINVVRSMLDAQQGALRDMGKELAEMPTGLDFFSRLRLERRGRHRGEFDLEQYALAPLIANVRMLAFACGLRETNTIARIKGLQEQGRLSVELTDRLVRAYHDLTSLKVQRQLAAGCADGDGCFIDPQGLTADQEFRLRNGLEAVSGLEKIAYLSFTEQK